MIGKDLLKQKLGKTLGNGLTTRAWTQPWLSLTSHKQPMGPPNKEDTNMLVTDLMKPNSKEWDLKKIRNTLPTYEQDILKL